MPASERHELVALDGLRAVAIALVLVHHFALVQMPGHFSGVTEDLLLGAGRLGVVLFFVVSGFVIWLPIARSIAAGDGPPDPGSFAVRRVVRILPAYWVAVVVQSWWVGESRLEGALEWATHLGLAQNLRHGAIFRGTLVGWTLAIEAAFYALVVIALLVLHRTAASVRPRLELGLVAALVVGPWLVRAGYVAWAADDVAVVGDWFAPPWWTLSLAWWADAFGLGMAVAVLVARRIHTTHRVATGVVTFAACVTLLLEATGRFVLRPGVTSRLALVGEVPTRAIPAALVVGAIALAPSAPLARVLAARSLVAVGTVSFGVYLWHLAVIRVVRDAAWVPDGIGIRFAIDVIGALLLGAASWHLLERPLIDRVRRRQRRASATAA